MLSVRMLSYGDNNLGAKICFYFVIDCKVFTMIDCMMKAKGSAHVEMVSMMTIVYNFDFVNS